MRFSERKALPVPVVVSPFVTVAMEKRAQIRLFVACMNQESPNCGNGSCGIVALRTKLLPPMSEEAGSFFWPIFNVLCFSGCRGVYFYLMLLLATLCFFS